MVCIETARNSIRPIIFVRPKGIVLSVETVGPTVRAIFKDNINNTNDSTCTGRAISTRVFAGGSLAARNFGSRGL